MMRNLSPLALAAVLLPVLAGCGALGLGDSEDPGNVEWETVDRHLELAGEEVAAGEYETAIDRLLPVRELQGISPESRRRMESLLAEAVLHLLAPESGCDSGDLRRLFRLELAPSLRARVGVAAAERMLEEGSRIDCYKMIKKVEDEIPNHSERALAGDVLARAGLSLARDDRRYLLIRRYESRGMAALELLVMDYPFESRCDEAYAELARIYEERRDLDLAIERNEDLLYYHSESPFATAAEARLPYLRLKRLKRDSYDRGEMLRAKREVEQWLARHPGHELEGWVHGVRAECLRRLASSDLILARYGERIDNTFGARMHAERALEEATEAGAEKEAAEARALLDSLPPAREPEPSEEGGGE